MRLLVDFAMLSFVMAVSVGLGSVQAEIMVGLTDDFEDLTRQGWTMGPPSPVQPQVVADGGPNGVGDAFLSVVSIGGFGPGSRLAVFNEDQWADDFIAAEVMAIEMFVNNPGSTAFSLRIAFGGPLQFNTWFASTDAIVLSPGSGWTAVSFPIGEADLTRVSGSNSYAQTLGDVPQLRIISSVNLGFQGDVIAATLEIDDVKAVVPEPSVAAMMLAIGAAVGWGRRRR